MTQQNLGEQVDLNDLKNEIDERRQSSSRFVKIEDGEIAELTFTGTVYRGVNSFGNAVMNFELTDSNSSGEHKIWSVGASNSVVRDVIAEIMENHSVLKIMRSGLGMETRYSIVKEKKKR